MSSSSVTACSRSPSPATPDTSEIPNIQVSLKSWCTTVPSNANDGEEGINFHDLIRETVFDSSVPAEHPSTYAVAEDILLNHSPLHMAQLTKIITPETINVLPTKPAPPPHPVQHVANVVHNVVCPPQGSCSNLPIVFPTIPETGTKSRVETQVRITVDLAHASSSQGPFLKYDRVGSWKCLKLPPNTSTKRRTRKEGKIDAAPQETLQLTAEVTCSSQSHMRVAVCSSCQSREAKRAARKVTSRVKPGAEEPSSERPDASLSLLQFNCPEELDFSTGSVVLPMRITCYCRHHREKVGFNVHFKMVDYEGRIVGSGSTPPIMITDDHKSTHKSQPLPHSLNPSAPAPDWNGSPGDVPRKPTQKSITVKKRAKPYDPSTRRKSLKDAKVETSSPSAISSVLPTRASSPAVATESTTPALSSTLSSPKASFDSLASPTDFISGIYGQSEIPMPDFNQALIQTLDPLEFTQAISSITSPSDPTTSPEVVHAVTVVQQPQPEPAIFFNFDPPPPISPFQLPKIHRLIPSAGPTHGARPRDGVTTPWFASYLPALPQVLLPSGLMGSTSGTTEPRRAYSRTRMSPTEDSWNWPCRWSV
ncbi:hypothetical protein BDM02DRAFT_2997187 [Thelephora ganbajun]|uniref:Uncharacterized protein n=1 Tax=Thelephora ganbajun TaxID=370292 RepID=A0ACB6ZAE1_THEGA|nr:hypothetical protein BDM02DRAFT_2997187 [Thelephora ganbajun]